MTSKQRDDMTLHGKDTPSSAERNEKNDDAPQSQEASENAHPLAQEKSETRAKEGVSTGAQQQSRESSQGASRTASAPSSSAQHPTIRYAPIYTFKRLHCDPLIGLSDNVVPVVDSEEAETDL
jgi:hypothetical protein